MARYLHQVGDEMFDIDVAPMPLCGCPFAPFFVARISRFARADRVPAARQLDRREAYGPTEDWALQNARDLLASQTRVRLTG